MLISDFSPGGHATSTSHPKTSTAQAAGRAIGLAAHANVLHHRQPCGVTIDTAHAPHHPEEMDMVWEIRIEGEVGHHRQEQPEEETIVVVRLHHPGSESGRGWAI